MPLPANLRHMVAAVVAAGAVAFPAHAQYTGPTAVDKATVADILKNPVDDQDVQLQGHLLRKISSDKYIFSDGSGEIVAEIKSRRFPSQPVDDKTKVEIIGEVDTGSRRPPEIEVDSVRVVE